VLHHEEPSHAPLPAEADAPALRFISPQLPSLADEPPEGDRWIHEIKYDGYRSAIRTNCSSGLCAAVLIPGSPTWSIISNAVGAGARSSRPAIARGR
jgi:hypothetical protein